METNVISLKSLVHVCAQYQEGPLSAQCHLDLAFDGDTFVCKLSTPARLLKSDKRVFLYLVLDASHVESLSICDKDNDIPSEVTNGFIKNSHCSGSSDITCIQFTLKKGAPLISSDSALRKKKSTCREAEMLLRLGQCERFKTYLPFQVLKPQSLSGLCTALARGNLRPAAGYIKTLYAGTGSRIITDLDELWSSTSDRLGNPPPYDASTAPGASNHETKGPRDTEHQSYSPSPRKRQKISPDVHQDHEKRQLCTEDAITGPEPWQLAFAAQQAQLATLSAELLKMREEMKQLRRPPMVDVEIQTDEAVEPQSEPEAQSIAVHGSQASTVEISVEDRLIMVEDDVIHEQKQRALLEEKVDKNDEQLRQTLDLDCNGLHEAIGDFESRVQELGNDFRESLDEKALELQVKLEEFIEQRLEDVEEAVKHDVRMAMENASFKFKMELGWTG